MVFSVLEKHENYPLGLFCSTELLGVPLYDGQVHVHALDTLQLTLSVTSPQDIVTQLKFDGNQLWIGYKNSLCLYDLRFFVNAGVGSWYRV
jgi:hypothetical protein